MISSLLLGPSHFLFFCHNRFLRSFACLPVFSGLQIFPLLATPISQSTPLHSPVVPNSNPALYSSALRLFKLLTLSVLQSLCHRIVVWSAVASGELLKHCLVPVSAVWLWVLEYYLRCCSVTLPRIFGQLRIWSSLDSDCRPIYVILDQEVYVSWRPQASFRFPLNTSIYV